jgi:Calcineurin-like phosphoesterase
MKIAFFGDVHGCVLHALGAAVLLQRHRGITLDALIQVGDLGAFPSADRWDEPTRRFAATTPAQGDFFRLLDPSPGLADGVRRALAEVPPFTFVSGNHEDHAWLAGLHAAAGDTLVPVDPLGAYRHVPCGEIVEVAGQRVAFLGRIEAPGKPFDYDEQAFARMLAAAPGSADILVTHDGPYGLSRNMRGEVQGSAWMTALIEHLRPRLHVGGHYHHENGPRYYGDTVSYTVAQLVPPVRTKWSPEPVNPRQQIVPGSIALLDTDSYAVEYIHDGWLADVHGDDLDLTALLTAAAEP